MESCLLELASRVRCLTCCPCERADKVGRRLALGIGCEDALVRVAVSSQLPGGTGAQLSVGGTELVGTATGGVGHRRITPSLAAW